MIPISKPYLPEKSLKYAHGALDSTFLSYRGPWVEKTTDKLQELLGCFVLPVANGTVATHLVSKTVSLIYPESEALIIPNNVYVAAINSFLFDKEFQAFASEANIETWNYDLSSLDKKIEILNLVGAMHQPRKQTQFHIRPVVLIVHNIGNIINVKKLQREYPDIIFVEDNCEGFLGKYEGKYSGTASLASSISFFANKQITSGEGGAFCTKDQNLYEEIKKIHGQGQSDKKFVHDVLGYNYRMTNIQAAILYGQLELLPEIIERKATLFEKYRFAFKDVPGIHFQKVEENTEHSNWMFGIRIENNPGYEIAEKYFSDNQIEIRPMFYPLSSHKHLQNNSSINLGNETIAKKLNQECIILPSFVELSNDEFNHIIHTTLSYNTAVQQGKA